MNKLFHWHLHKLFFLMENYTTSTNQSFLKSTSFLKLLIALCVTAIVIVALVMISRQNQVQDRFSVSATGEVYAKADIANLVVGFRTETKKTAAEAVQENSEKMNEIIKELKGLNIEAKDIKTTNYNLTPIYDWTESKGRELEGYQVSQNITIKIRNLDNIGEAIAKTAAKGANQIGGIDFTIDDEEELKNQARSQAIEKAKDKAEKIKKETGIKLGDIVNVYENQVNYPQVRYSNEMALGLGGGGEIEAPVIEAGENEVSVEVTVVWKVK